MLVLVNLCHYQYLVLVLVYLSYYQYFALVLVNLYERNEESGRKEDKNKRMIKKREHLLVGAAGASLVIR